MGLMEEAEGSSRKGALFYERKGVRTVLCRLACTGLRLEVNALVSLVRDFVFLEGLGIVLQIG
jgi:hypothetical protein